MVRKVAKILAKIIGFLILIIVIGTLIYTAPYIWNRISVYPKLEKEKNELQSKYKKPVNYIKQKDYKGVFHAHSYWSHDSRGILTEILYGAKKAKLDFLFLSDHPHSKLDSFPRGYKGIYDGLIIEPGTEASTGLMVSPMDSVVLDWSQPEDQVIKQVVNSGGLVLYVHTEKPHRWANPDYQAMEIYNIHTDLLDENDDMTSLILNAVFNGKKYGHWAMYEIFDEQNTILKRWDSINRFKHVTGMAASDAHNNQNIRARYTKDGLVEWVGPNAKTIAIVKPGWKENLLLSEPDEAGWAFKFETDTYFLSYNYVNTHVFCDTLSNTNIKDNLVAGHAFIAFEALAEAKGFQYFSTDSNQNVNAIMGDSISVKKVHQLKATSPLPVQFRLIRDGKIIDTVDDVYSYAFDPKNKDGNYRLEARLKFEEKLVPWIYSNPIYISNKP